MHWRGGYPTPTASRTQVRCNSNLTLPRLEREAEQIRVERPHHLHISPHTFFSLPHLSHRLVSYHACLGSADDPQLTRRARLVHKCGRPGNAQLLELGEYCRERRGGWRDGAGIVLDQQADEVVDVLERLVRTLPKVLYVAEQLSRIRGCVWRPVQLTGLVGCAASPINSTRLLCHVVSSGRSYKPY